MMFISLVLLAVVLYSILFKAGDIGNWINKSLRLNNFGNIDLGDKESFTPDEVKDLIAKNVDSLVQPKIDSIVTSRLAQERGKYTDYEELKKFKADSEASSAANEQKNLEAAGKYEEAMKLHTSKVSELTGLLGEKDNTISSMTVGNALTSEIINQGGHLEETLAMLKSSAQLKDGIVTIAGKDTNGQDQALSVAEGVKSFLEKRPHLVRAKGNDGGAGSGAGAGGDGAGAGAGGEDLNALNDLLTKQRFSNDYKGAQETTGKIKALMAKNGNPIASGIAY